MDRPQLSLWTTDRPAGFSKVAAGIPCVAPADALLCGTVDRHGDIVGEYADMDATKIETPKRSARNTLNDLTGREWIAETKSVWFQKGLGASHEHAQIERLHPAPFSYQDVARLIRFFTKAGGRVLDPFLGVGSTLKACATTGRYGVGVELIDIWAGLSKQRLRDEVGPAALDEHEVIAGDSRVVLGDTLRFPDASFDFVVTSPPYWRILTKRPDHKVKAERLSRGLAVRYSEDDARDLGNLEDYDEFLTEVTQVFRHCWRLLKPGKYAAIVVGDFRHGSQYVAYHADLISRLTAPDDAFELHGINILIQNHKRLYPYGYPSAYVPNLHHQYVLILRKPKVASKLRSGVRNPQQDLPLKSALG